MSSHVLFYFLRTPVMVSIQNSDYNHEDWIMMNWRSQKLIKSRKLGENYESCIADVAAIKCRHLNCLILTNQYSLLIPKACELGEPKKYMLTCQSRVRYSQTIGFTLVDAFSLCNGLSLSWSPSKRTLYFEENNHKSFLTFFLEGGFLLTKSLPWTSKFCLKPSPCSLCSSALSYQPEQDINC